MNYININVRQRLLAVSAMMGIGFSGAALSKSKTLETVKKEDTSNAVFLRDYRVSQVQILKIIGKGSM